MIQSPLLEHVGGYVAGRWAAADAGGTIAVRNPSTGEHLADVPDMGAGETAAAVESAAAVLERGATGSLDDRRRWLVAVHDLLLENKAELALVITAEQGKPLKESAAEVEYAAGFFGFFATQLHRLAAEPLAEPVKGLRWTVHHRPAGVAGLITPWNFPLAMLAKKLAAALGAGCGVVAKPADLTPLTAVALWHLLDRIGLPPGMANLVIGRPAPIGDELCAHPDVRLISFTGSTAIGRHLIANTAPHVKRLALELGGNAPYIVLDDADVEAAASVLMPNKFRCAGQTCVCANRILVHRPLAAAFTEAVAARVAALRVGNGTDPAADIGPLINRSAFEKVERHVVDALARGARRVTGAAARPPAGDFGAFYPPTVLTGTTPDMLLSREETFGPVVAIGTFEDEDEAVRLANGTPYGLAAYVFTGDEQRSQRVAGRLRFGHVGVNTGMGPTPKAPFGGTKQSGFGREGGAEGLLEFCESQTVVGP